MATLLVGAGNMAKEYAKVLSNLERNYKVVGRSAKGCEEFTKTTGIDAISGGLENFLKSPQYRQGTFDDAIVTSNIEELSRGCLLLLKAGFRRILVEKPAGTTLAEVGDLCDAAALFGAEIYVAYNRRFYASTLAARKLIQEDGGPLSFHFEFTEWSHVIEKLDKPVEVKQKWFIANSSHVLDLAFFLGGEPEDLKAYSAGGVEWHPSGTVFAGAGRAKTGALFSYLANWESAGRWGVEIMTRSRRLILKPLETLQIQERGKIPVEEFKIDDRLDKEYKPGLYLQTKSFLEGPKAGLLDLQSHLNLFKWYEMVNPSRPASSKGP